MARTKRSRRSYGADEWGRNRSGCSRIRRPACSKSSGGRTGAGSPGCWNTASGGREEAGGRVRRRLFIEAPNGNAAADAEPLTLDSCLTSMVRR